MLVDHDAVVGFAKSFGLFYLMTMAAVVLIYVFWPANSHSFDRAANEIIEDEDEPWQ